MNTERIRQLRDHLQAICDNPKLDPAKDVGFNMYHWISYEGEHAVGPTCGPAEDWCGTTACLHGHAAILFGDLDGKLSEALHNEEGSGATRVFDRILFDDVGNRDYLGLTSEDQWYMFHGHWHPDESMMNITLRDAITYLTKVLETGDVRCSLSWDEVDADPTDHGIVW